MNKNNNDSRKDKAGKTVKSSGFALWIALGLIFGVAFKHIGLGLALGVLVGVITDNKKSSDA